MNAPIEKTVLLLALMLPVSSGGQSPTSSSHREVPLSSIGPQMPVGMKIRVVGKYKERISDELILYECETPFLVRNEQLNRTLRDLIPRRDNLSISGTVVASATYGRAIEVDALARGPSDLEVFQRESDLLRERSSTAAGDELTTIADELFELAQRLVRHQEIYRSPELTPLVRSVLKRSYLLRSEALPPGDPRPQLRFVQRVNGILDDREFLMEFLLDLWIKHPGDDRVRQGFAELNCRRYKGRWVTYEEFKRQEGLVQHEGAWMTPDLKDFHVAVNEFRLKGESSLLLLRRRTEREYALLGKSGRVEAGMNRKEVYSALGFPDRVRRRNFRGKEFDQWSYDGKHYYFYSDQLIRLPERE